MHVIIDTDIGDDIDDAIALAYALGSTELDVIGITCVFGDVITRAQIARRLCEYTGHKNIPVIPGESLPLNGAFYPDTKPERCSQIACVADDNKSFPISDAAAFILEAAQRHPGELRIITIGAMTNVAKALQEQPHRSNHIAEIISLAGYLPPRLREPEWNVRYDPEAAAVIAQSTVPWTVVGADTAKFIGLKRNELDIIAAHGKPHTEFLSELIVHWYKNKAGIDCQNISDVPFTHTADVGAIAALIDRQFHAFESGTISVDSDGALAFMQDDNGCHRIATSAMPEDYKKTMMQRIQAAGENRNESSHNT